MSYYQEDIDYYRALELEDMKAHAERWEAARLAAEAMEISADRQDDEKDRDFWHEVTMLCENRAHRLFEEHRRQAADWGFEG
jgi:hypothetical protein